MSYFGVRIKYEEQNYITIKLHGPLDRFVIDPLELKNAAYGLLESYKKFSLAETILFLAEALRDVYCNGDELVWVEVESITTPGNILFGASAEVNVNV